ncbi:Ejaculatory bulb-specific protein 3, partial [Operophtera brumata]
VRWYEHRRDASQQADGSRLHEVPGRYREVHVRGTHKGVRKVVNYMVKKEPQVWEKLVKIYDPKGEYSRRYKDEINTLKKE